MKMANRRSRWIWVAVMVEVAIIAALSYTIFVQYQESNVNVDVSLSDWMSAYIEYADGWQVDESVVSSEAGIDMIYGPYIALQKGTYTVDIDYTCDENQHCRIYAGHGQMDFIEAGQSYTLSKNRTHVSCDFTVTEDIEDFELVVEYNGKGNLEINNITICSTPIGFQRILAIVVVLSILIDACIYFRKYIEANRLYFLTLCGIVFLVSCPLFAKGIANGHDLTFHLMRIEGLADELHRGVFPVRLASLWMDGYGYPVSVLYGDIFLYLPAALRIIGFPVVTAYKVYIFTINAGTVLMSFYCFRGIFKNKGAALLTAFAYTSAGYRVVCIYVRAAVGEFTAMMFIPLIALAVYKFYTVDVQNWRHFKRYALYLAIGMSGVIVSHVLTTEMIVVALLVVGLVLWERTFTKNVLRAYALAMAETVALSAWFLIPFLDYFLLYYVLPDHLGIDGFPSLAPVSGEQANGAYIAQYFAFFQDMFGWSVVDISSRLGLTPGLALMAGMIIGIYVWANEKATRTIKLYLVLSIAMLFVASNVFPWNYLYENTALGKILAAVRLPWRYLTIADIFLTMLLGALCSLTQKDVNLHKGFCILVAGACIISSLFYISNYTTAPTMRHVHDTAEIDTYSYMGGEYLRVTRSVPTSFTGEIVYEDVQEPSLVARDGTHLELYCVTSGTDGTVELPILNYRGYQIVDEYGNQYSVEDGTNNVIRFSIPVGFSGIISVDFVEPWYWRLGEIVSLVTVLAIGARWIRTFSRKRTTQENVARRRRTSIA